MLKTSLNACVCVTYIIEKPEVRKSLGIKKACTKKNQAQNNFPPRNGYKVTDLMISSIKVFSDYV